MLEVEYELPPFGEPAQLTNLPKKKTSGEEKETCSRTAHHTELPQEKFNGDLKINHMYVFCRRIFKKGNKYVCF